MQTVTVAGHAMATRFELVLHGENSVALRAAGEAALNEIERLEAQLSLYRPGSEIAQLNARAAREAVRVTPRVFGLLQQAQRLSEETGGAFDITVAPLVRCWGFMGGSGKIPDAGELAEAKARVGMNLVRLNPDAFTVRFAREGVMLDLGAIGKGCAVEKAAEILREAGVASALIHGGTSTVYAIGKPPAAEFWNVAIEKPQSGAGFQPVAQARQREQAKVRADAAGVDRQDACSTLLASVPLKDEALSVSAVWGKSFQADGKTFGHVLDPRTGHPVESAVLAAVVLPSATETDALSTALLVGGEDGHERISRLRPRMRTLVAAGAGSGFRVRTRGFSLNRRMNAAAAPL